MLKTSFYELSKINNYTYNLFIKDDEYRDVLYSSILMFLRHGFYNDDTFSIFITCEKIQSLSNYLIENDNSFTYEQSLQLINSLSIQINYLQEKGYGFYGIDSSDVVVINNNIFLIISDKHLLKYHNEELLFINKMIHKPIFFNPEINLIHQLPATINHKCMYYSLAVLVIHCMFDCDVSSDELTQVIQSIQYTKLFYFLERCLHPNAEKRILLFA
jgi:hypothetical protein